MAVVPAPTIEWGPFADGPAPNNYGLRATVPRLTGATMHVDILGDGSSAFPIVGSWYANIYTVGANANGVATLWLNQEGQAYLQAHTLRVNMGGLYTAPFTGPGKPPPPPPPPPTGGPPIDLGTFPTPPNSLNPIDWLSWLGQVFKWAVVSIGQLIADQAQALATAFWNALPDNLKNFLTGWAKVAETVADFFVNPGKYYRQHATAKWEEGSDSAGTIDYKGRIIQAGRSLIDPTTVHIPTIQDVITGNISKWMATYGPLIHGILTSDWESPDAAMQAINDLRAKFLADAEVQVLAWELIPFINLTAPARVVQHVGDSLGFLTFDATYNGQLYATGLAEKFRQAALKSNRAMLPGFDALTRLLATGRITTGQFQTWAPLTGGYTDEIQNLVYKLHLTPPTLEDLILYKRRYPGKNVDLAQYGDLTGTDFERFADIFNERQWNDLPIRTLKIIYQAGKISKNDIRIAIRRQGFRPDRLEGQEKSDFDVMYDYVTAGQQGTLAKANLDTVERLYLLGERSLGDLQTAASQVYSDPIEAATYTQAAQNRQALVNLRPKHFTYLQLIKFAEAGIDVDKIRAGDLAATGLDAAHQAIVGQYIDQAIAAYKLKHPGG